MRARALGEGADRGPATADGVGFASPQSLGIAPAHRLFTNHIDACGVTLIIAALCTVLHGQATPATFPILGTLAVTCWFAFAVNDYFDARQDAADPFKRTRNFFVGRSIPRGHRVVGGAVVIALIGVGFASFGTRGLLEYAVALAAIMVYSAPPLRLKGRPVLDLAMHGFFVETAPYYATLFLLDAPWNALDRTLIALFFLGSLAAQVEQQTRDYATDLGGERTFATMIGLRPAALLLRILSGLFGVLIVVAFFVGVIPVWFIPFGLIGLPVIVHRFTRRPDEPRSQRLIIAVLALELAYMAAVYGAAFVRDTGRLP
jgi:4-hydroxybenzoate polyprenyltransferase